MKTVEVSVVRIYTLERADNVPQILNYLQNEAKILGISVYRGLSGFGETGVQTDDFLDISFSLPLIIEFFDEPEKVKAILDYLGGLLENERFISFNAQMGL
ncbi:hypothetical protein BN59_03271 [Legionella massiliensis]|uniref:Uncharacterized protein n=1 Tax=Legionella massiliensis TaxID=1034943 RepID=A0A078L1A2_9GAMM|nr:DUF190 domain-containing protein [Legionella massiliensis]CDZ78956.1 hypothetical protein BN59_03271 [Legionella massiliensis]CEE14694.1 hypothetical protein BN1094_03271 [Legionella massiliensis]